jgi:hypothetical protein
MTKARDLANIISGGFTADDIPNIDASKITSGSIADARIPESAVSQHATSFDDNKIVNDISTLALRQASDQNKSAYNTNSQSVDVFQDDTGIASNTNTLRTSDEYVGSIYSDTVVPTITALAGVSENLNPVYSLNTSSGLITHNHTSTGREFTSAGVHGCRLDFGKNVTFSSGLYLQMTDIFDDSSNANMGVCEFNFSTSAGSNWLFQNSAIIPTVNEYTTSGAWDNMTIGGTDKFYNGNTTTYEGRYINLSSLPASIKYSWTENSATISARYCEVRFSNTWGRPKTFNIFSGATGTTSPSGTNIGQGIIESVANATGNFIGNTITAPSSVSSMGAIITYQNQAGTNALNTDIVLQLSADGGSNYTTATLVAMPDFSSGIKMAKVNDLAVTAGTSLKYKISFANQASGSKEARIRGVSLQY